MLTLEASEVAVPDAEKTVFISYRRSVSRHLARAIFLDLREHDYDVFLDVNTIDNGEFDAIILNQIAARAHFVLVLSKGSLERCANSGDWLRREIEEALRLNRNVVPIIEEGFDFAAEARYLPELAERSAALQRHSAVSLLFRRGDGDAANAVFEAGQRRGVKGKGFNAKAQRREDAKEITRCRGETKFRPIVGLYSADRRGKYP